MCFKMNSYRLLCLNTECNGFLAVECGTSSREIVCVVNHCFLVTVVRFLFVSPSPCPGVVLYVVVSLSCPVVYRTLVPLSVVTQLSATDHHNQSPSPCCVCREITFLMTYHAALYSWRPSGQSTP